MHTFDPDRVIAVMGDVHGDRAWIGARLQSLGERGIKTVVQVGDFGLWPNAGGKVFLDKVEKVCARYALSLMFVLGNHDWPGQVNDQWANPKRRNADGSLQPLHLRDHVVALPRGHRWEKGGRSFVALGGAPSIDFEHRRAGKNWWPGEEQITDDDVERTIAGGYADVLLCHDQPGEPWATPPVAHILRTNPMGWSDKALEYVRPGRERITRVFTEIAPRLTIGGHYHVHGQATFRLPGRDYDSTIWSLDTAPRQAVRLLDLDALTDAPPVSRGHDVRA